MRSTRSLALILMGLMLSMAPVSAQSFAEEPAMTTIHSTPVSANVSSKPLRGIPAAPKTAAPADELLEIKTNLPAGTRYRLEVTDTERRVRDGVTVFSVTVVTYIDLVVRETMGDVAVFELTFGAPRVQNIDDSFAARMFVTAYKMSEGTRVVYRTDGTGTVIGLVNAHEVEKNLNDMIDQLLRAVRRETNDPMIVAAIRAHLEPMRQGSYTEELALDLSNLIHFFSGLALDAATNYSQSRIMRLDLNGAEVPSELDYDLAWFDRAKRVAWLSWSEVADSGQIADVVKTFMRDLSTSVGQPLPRRFDFGAARASEGAIHELDLDTGLPRRIAYFRQIEMLGFTDSRSVQFRAIQ